MATALLQTVRLENGICFYLWDSIWRQCPQQAPREGTRSTPRNASAPSPCTPRRSSNSCRISPPSSRTHSHNRRSIVVGRERSRGTDMHMFEGTTASGAGELYSFRCVICVGAGSLELCQFVYWTRESRAFVPSHGIALYLHLLS